SARSLSSSAPSRSSSGLSGSSESRNWTCDMGIGLIAVAGVLLLGAGVMILVVNLSKPRGSSATIDQIQTYGYVAETTGGSEGESVARRPIDSVAGRLGDWLGRRSDRFGEERMREKLVSAGVDGTTARQGPR